MILYLDTSALVKKYFEEKSSPEVISAWKSSLGISTSAVAYAELLAAVYRKASEARVKKSLFESVVSTFQEDWSSFIIVEVDNRLNETIHKVIANHGLRGFDAIHLASALTIGSAVADDFIFACYDERLRYAARAEGLETLPSSAPGRSR
jgi:predicted nucleic acid-binding protein